MNFNPTLTLGPKIKSRYLSGLRIKAKTIKFLEENIRIIFMTLKQAKMS